MPLPTISTEVQLRARHLQRIHAKREELNRQRIVNVFSAAYLKRQATLQILDDMEEAVIRNEPVRVLALMERIGWKGQVDRSVNGIK